MHLTFAAAGLIGAAAVAAHGDRRDDTEPCAQIADIASSGGRYPSFSVDLALACLHSVPLDKDGGMAQLQGIRYALQFQTTHAYLKDPPPGYLYPGSDLFGQLDAIMDSLSNDKYTNEYDFQEDIRVLFTTGRDLHLEYSSPCTEAFAYSYDDSDALSLLSVSSDGLEIPKIYKRSDVQAHHDLNGISAVTTINGVSVEQWLNQYTALNGDSQEPDGNYNKLFQTVIGSLFTASLGASFNPVTDNLTVTYDDGSSHSYVPKAFIEYNIDFSGIQDGQSYFDRFCSGNNQGQGQAKAQKQGAAQQPSVLSHRRRPTPQTHAVQQSQRGRSGTKPVPFKPVQKWTTQSSPNSYPPAVIFSQDQSVGGYFLNDNKTAVLSFINFSEEDPIDFQNSVRQFLATCYDQKKTRLIIDLRGNPGGNVFYAFDTFKQLFPDQDPYGISNFRAHPLLHDLIEAAADYYTNNPSDSQQEYFFLSKYRLNTWQDLYGPVVHHDGNFTNAIQWNLTDVNEAGFSLTDYNDEKGYDTVTVFKPENIVLLQDGGCSSTCTIFSELMKTQAHVRQIAFGGRAQKGPMQGVGGVKGSNVYELSTISSEVYQGVNKYANADQKQAIQTKNPGLIDDLTKAAAIATVARVNIRNQIRHGDEDTATPLQFVYEAADCRRFYTGDQYYDQSVVWSSTVDAIWGNGGCVEGSTNQPSSKVLTGQDELIAPPDSARWNYGFPDLRDRTLKAEAK